MRQLAALGMHTVVEHAIFRITVYAEVRLQQDIHASCMHRRTNIKHVLYWLHVD